MQIEEIPLLVNGKVDRQKLLKLFENQHGRMAGFKKKRRLPRRD